MDFVDVDTSKDVKLFLDPLLLSDGFRNIVNDFVNTVYKMYTLGNKAGAFQLFSHSKECNAIHFGYSESNSKGTGVSMKMLDQFFGYVYKSVGRIKEKLLTPIAMPIFVKSFSEDRLSDLLVSLLKKELILYSLEQARLHGLKISNEVQRFDCWDSESHEWATFESQYVLAPNENGVEELLILVPKSVVSKRFLVNPSRYISVIFQHLQLMEKYQRTNGTPKSQKELRESEIVANYQKDKDKSYILDMTLLSPEYYEAYYDNSIRFSDNKSLNDEELIEILTNK
ncbi:MULTISPECIES: hypothetical protein [Streptococcus]|mgnify:FL=1|uniref:Uncharacterized protein n=1 Tax=Streptococcus oralis TaxID=1303 RepID=A0A081R2L6_STROR|nr:MULTISPECIES: hypothetical protein [Streptococcus]MDU8037466.1 hypothetical protein [Streptococcus sp.]KEQ49439.1 hypothetical protein SK143_1381 [Streptococcus oralis]MDK7118466.1 hypothetical protein [Streptococcus oralis]MDU0952424.1 hypothetical protein [Streptococcus oralis]MDU3458518.1 hypothetical protein [Streptococcus oralis]